MTHKQASQDKPLQLPLYTEAGAVTPQYKDATLALLSKISGVKHPSELKPLRHEIASARLGEEANVVFDALQARRGQLVISNGVEPPADVPEFLPILEETVSKPVQQQLPMENRG